MLREMLGTTGFHSSAIEFATIDVGFASEPQTGLTFGSQPHAPPGGSGFSAESPSIPCTEGQK